MSQSDPGSTGPPIAGADEMTHGFLVAVNTKRSYVPSLIGDRIMDCLVEIDGIESAEVITLGEIEEEFDTSTLGAMRES